MCAQCLCVHPTRSFSTRCRDCDQVYFCSLACHDSYISVHKGTWICGAMRKLATLKVDKHGKSVAKLVLAVYWERQTRGQRLLHCTNVHGLKSTFEHVLALESHYDDWPDDDRKEWRRLQQFLFTQLSSNGILEEHETEVDIMHLVSRIESNCFGLYLEKKSKEPVGRGVYAALEREQAVNFKCLVLIDISACYLRVQHCFLLLHFSTMTVLIAAKSSNIQTRMSSKNSLSQ